MIQFERLPVITKDDVPVITGLLEVFDEITFNSRGELLATFNNELPIVGPVVFSYYVRESHLQVRRKVDDKAIFNDSVDNPTTRIELLSIVMRELKAGMNGLTPTVVV